MSSHSGGGPEGEQAVAEAPSVLIVDDDAGWRDLTKTRLGDDYAVRAVASGRAAIDAHADDHFDVVLLDRQMPGLSGRETLTELRAAGYDGPVALVTNVEPEVAIADWPFDDYVMKSAHVGDLTGVVDRLLRRVTFGNLVRERYALAAKKATLEVEHEASTLDASAEYARLVDRLDELRRGIDPCIADLPADQAFTELLED